MVNNVIISVDDKYEYGKSYDEKTNDFLGDWIRFIGEFSHSPIDFTDKNKYPLYGVPVQARGEEPTKEYLEVCRKYPLKD